MKSNMTEAWPAFVGEEIENWIAASWQGESPEPREPDRCRSLEGAYRAPDANSQDEDDTPPRRIVNREHAALVQRAWERMPFVGRRILQYEYLNRSRYDIWERDMEISPSGEYRPVWVRIGNIRRERARIELGVTRDEYHAALVLFKTEIVKEFQADEVCA